MARRYLLDSGPGQDFIFRRRGVAEKAEAAKRAGAKVGLCLPTVGEIVGGLAWGSLRESPLRAAHRRLGLLTKWPFDYAAALEYGHLYAEHR